MKTEHYPVFDCAIGERAVHYTGHVRMMGAVQPFISRRDLEDRGTCPKRSRSTTWRRWYVDAWKLGVKAIAIYRDNCKVAQPLSGKGDKGQGTLTRRRR